MAISSHKVSEYTNNNNNNNNNKVIHHQWSHSRNNNKDFIDYKYIDSLSPCYSYHASKVGTQSARREIDPINKRLHHSIGAEGIPACSISFSSTQVTIRIIMELIHAIHVIQRRKYPSHISSRNHEAKKSIIYLQYPGTTGY
jgi:hypothetical protein